MDRKDIFLLLKRIRELPLQASDTGRRELLWKRDLATNKCYIFKDFKL